MWFGFGDDGSWRLSGLLPPDEGAGVERALALARQELINAAEGEEDKRAVTWADALVAVAERYLASDAAARPYAERHLVHVHLEADASGSVASLHLGPFLSDALRRQVTCDAKGRIVIRHGGVPLSVGRTARIVPDRTRVAVEHRDGSCRVPGCDRRRWVRSTTSSTGRTAVPPTPPTWWRCAPATTASTTGACSTSPATPTTPTGWSSPTPGDGASPARAAPPHQTSSPSPPPTAIPPASASMPPACGSARRRAPPRRGWSPHR